MGWPALVPIKRTAPVRPSRAARAVPDARHRSSVAPEGGGDRVTVGVCAERYTGA